MNAPIVTRNYENKSEQIKMAQSIVAVIVELKTYNVSIFLIPEQRSPLAASRRYAKHPVDF